MKKTVRTNKKVIFYRYQRNTLAINHTWGKDAREIFLELPILPCHLCLQYSEYKDLMDAASHDLRNKKDGKWIYDGEYGWQHHLMEPFEETACQEAIKRYRKPANQHPR